MILVHATAVARWCAPRWRAALLFGPSASGKSDLALRALHAGWKLVSDDYAQVWVSGGKLWTRAPDTMPGLIEARGVGLIPADRLMFAEAILACQCASGELARLPDKQEVVLLEGLSLPCISLKALESSALAKLDRVLSTRALGA